MEFVPSAQDGLSCSVQNGLGSNDIYHVLHPRSTPLEKVGVDHMSYPNAEPLNKKMHITSPALGLMPLGYHENLGLIKKHDFAPEIERPCFC
jgi:hypothetical protein